MTTAPTGPAPGRRDPLTKERVVRTAVAMADESRDGVPSMRRLAERLGVEAMTLYHHFRNKEVILDHMVDAVFEEIALPAEEDRWQEGMRRRAASMRAALARHRWAIGLMDSRADSGPATLRHHDAVIGCLRAGGFSIAGAAHAFSVLDGYVYGFVLQEISLPLTSADEVEEVADSLVERLPRERFPHLAEMIADYASRPDYSYGDEFDIGLELIIEGLERRRGHWR